LTHTGLLMEGVSLLLLPKPGLQGSQADFTFPTDN